MSNRDIDIANRYHTATKRLYLPLEHKPLAYKPYPELSPIFLPTDMASLDMPALKAVANLGSPERVGQTCNLEILATLLFYTAGRIRQRNFTGAGTVTFRAAASAGGLYPIEVYVVCGDLPGLTAGVYHFSPIDFALRGLREGDYRLALSQAVGDDLAAAAPVTLVFSSVFWRSAWKYQARSYRYCFWDNGTMGANLLAATAALGLPAKVLMGFVDDQVNHVLGLDGQREASLCLVPIGQADELALTGDMGHVPPLAVETAPDSEEIHYPEMSRLHAASALSAPDEVATWRRPVVMPPGRRTGLRLSLATEVPDAYSLGQAIRQRGSTRRFAREAMSHAQLSAILAHATTSFEADFLNPEGPTLLSPYLIVNAVEGVPSGSYVFSPSDQTLICLREGAFREEAGHLCFEQALGADASVVMFFMADLEAVLQHFGNRGYRTVQLEAGVVGGKMYLCAYALGLGASGLTFFDDEVTAFFSPDAAGKRAIFVVALGKTASENRVRPFRSRLGMKIDALSRRDALES
ncbi:SagB/ThcOx family dehydrogenase [Candidatus Entotheonella palauensis]|uniref:SagB/ThcOx family dehydrogenase n=1 Tax=Candidatus Entotheonella palauensis TaxID=93172 RepID=UPI0015C44AD0|nr:SagB/ThcOx family dehydrogenase [Candidatus Entotheonella palauensis]